MIIHCIDRLEANLLLVRLVAKGRVYEGRFDEVGEDSVVVCECAPGCSSVWRTGSAIDEEQIHIDEIRDSITAGEFSSAYEGGDSPDLSTLSEEETVPEHEDGDVSVLQGELWDTGTGSLNIPGFHDRIPSVGELYQDLMQSQQGLERLRDVMAAQHGRSFVHGSDGRREDSTSGQGLRGGAPRMGNQARNWPWPEGREQD